MQQSTFVAGEALRIDAVRSFLRAIDAVGGPAALAQLVGETTHRVTHWREIPLRHVFAIEAATGIRHEELRPDVDFSSRCFASPWPNSEGDWIPLGVDITDRIGRHATIDQEAVQAAAFAQLQAAFKKACDEPGMRNFRACAAAADEFERVFL